MVKAHFDFGHGGRDPGALGNGLREKDLTLAIGMKTAKIVERHGVQMSYSRTSDVFVDLTTRANMANKANADIFVSFHINSAENNRATGLEIWTSIGQTAGDKLATAIGEQLQKDFPNIAFRKDMSDGDLDKESNFTVLAKTKMAACLVEYMFIVNPSDAQILRTKQDEFAESTAKGILNYLKIKYIDTNKSAGFPIISKTKATVEQAQEWAREKNANKLFIDLAPDFFEIANSVGVNPLVAYCQSAKESGYMKFGGVINASFNNPCGLKTKAGGGDKDPNAHQRFKNWREGIQAQVDHLALYAGAKGYPKTGTPDPRHFTFIKGTAPTVESLGGKWAPAASYGTEILKMIKEIEATVAPAKPIDPHARDIRINLLGKIVTVKGRYKDNTNYIDVKGKDIPIRDIFEAMGLTVAWENNMVVIKQ